VELKALLKENRDAFVRGMTDKLLMYALGRGLERAGPAGGGAIAAKLPERNHKFAALVEEIVLSLPFQQRRAVLTAGSGAKSE
jgi:hypothetical protein